MLNLIVRLYLLSKTFHDSFIFLDIETSKIRETQYRVEKAIQDLLYRIRLHFGVTHGVCITPFASLHLPLSIPQAYNHRYTWLFHGPITQERAQQGTS